MKKSARLAVEPPTSGTTTRLDKHETFDRLRKEGWRVGQILILVKRGKTAEVARQIFDSYMSVESISTRVDSMANIFAEVFYKDSAELHAIIEGIRSMPNVSTVQFSEVIEIIRARSLEEVLESRH